MNDTNADDAIRDALRAAPSGPCLLALDYDGTLAPFRADRAGARPPAELRALLAALVACERVRAAIVSGRPLAELEALIGLDPAPELFGAHGWERRLPDGRRDDREPPAAAAGLLETEWRSLGPALGAQRLERKSASLALHLRGAPPGEAAALAARVGARWRGLAEGRGLELRRFDGGLELRCRGRDKGDALRELLDGLPPDAPAAYLGDDETDEDAFRALAGRGVAVLVADRPRPTAAAHVVPRAAVAGLLRAWLAGAGCAP